MVCFNFSHYSSFQLNFKRHGFHPFFFFLSCFFSLLFSVVSSYVLRAFLNPLLFLDMHGFVSFTSATIVCLSPCKVSCNPPSDLWTFLHQISQSSLSLFATIFFFSLSVFFFFCSGFYPIFYHFTFLGSLGIEDYSFSSSNGLESNSSSAEISSDLDMSTSDFFPWSFLHHLLNLLFCFFITYFRSLFFQYSLSPPQS